MKDMEQEDAYFRCLMHPKEDRFRKWLRASQELRDEMDARDKYIRIWLKVSKENVSRMIKIRELEHLVDGLARVLERTEPYFRYHCEETPPLDNALRKERERLAKGICNVLKEATHR